MQYVDTGKLGIFFTILMVVFILFNIFRASKGKKELFVRRIPGLNALDDAVGRATEMGRPIIMVPGIGELNAVSVQALNVFAHVTKKAAQFGTPIRLCCANAAVFTVAQEVIRDVYQTSGLIERYDSQNAVQFISDRQFAFAAGVSGMILRDKAAASFLLGEFYAESLIFAETANSIGAVQIAGSTKNTQTPFFIAACDYVLIGDEFYAASAFLTRQPVLVGSLVGQDWCKMLMTATMVFGLLSLSYQRTQSAEQHVKFGGDGLYYTMEEAKEGDKMKAADTFVFRLFNPMIPKEEEKNYKRTREYEKGKSPEELAAASAEGGS